MQGVWATCFTFNLVTWVLLCLVCLCSCWVVGVVVLFQVPKFFAGHCHWPIRASSFSRPQRLDDRQSLGARTAAAQKKN